MPPSLRQLRTGNPHLHLHFPLPEDSAHMGQVSPRPEMTRNELIPLGICHFTSVSQGSERELEFGSEDQKPLSTLGLLRCPHVSW